MAFLLLPYNIALHGNTACRASIVRRKEPRDITILAVYVNGQLEAVTDSGD
jgi:hypothetical protein